MLQYDENMDFSIDLDKFLYHGYIHDMPKYAYSLLLIDNLMLADKERKEQFVKAYVYIYENSKMLAWKRWLKEFFYIMKNTMKTMVGSNHLVDYEQINWDNYYLQCGYSKKEIAELRKKEAKEKKENQEKVRPKKDKK